jgi:hypothetical protein
LHKGEGAVEQSSPVGGAVGAKPFSRDGVQDRGRITCVNKDTSGECVDRHSGYVHLSATDHIGGEY